MNRASYESSLKMTFRGHSSPLLSATFSLHDSNMFLTGALDATMSIWSLPTRDITPSSPFGNFETIHGRRSLPKTFIYWTF